MSQERAAIDRTTQECENPSGNQKPVPLKVKAPPDFRAYTREDLQQSIPSRFEKIVREFPNQPAIQTDNESLSYAEFDRAVNRVANAILKRFSHRSLNHSGAGGLDYWEEHAEPAVLFMDQSLEAVTAIMALLKAGKLFATVDPNDPNTRNKFILNHVPAKIILTNRKYLPQVQALAPKDAEYILVDELKETGNTTSPSLEIARTEPAIIVYTSGSTGQPKGAVYNHESLLHDQLVKTQLVTLAPSDHIALLSWSTGQAIKIVFTSLLSGAYLHLYPLKRKGVSTLATWIIENKISQLLISTPICRSLMEILTGSEEFKDLRVIRTANDTVYPEDIDRIRKHFGTHYMLVNALSSIETGSICGYVMDPDPQFSGSRVPVGYPLDDISVQLLDESGCAIEGEGTGSIAITSRYLSRGYWRRPDLTAAAYYRDANDPGLVTFRSADLARRRPDGALELMGRNDFQIKIRGYRVDLVEVESTLLKHEQVREAVVHPYEVVPGEKRLVGYVVPRKLPAPTTSQLHQFLKDKVTDYMIPSAFVILESIPLLPTGKTNRRALPAPGRERPVLDNPYVEADTELERRLAEIWCQVLDIEQVGIQDDFMELGGDSLKAGQVIARIVNQIGVELALPQLFESSTIANLARHMEEQDGPSEKRSQIPSIERTPGSGPWQLSSGQKRLLFLNKLNPGSPAYNMPKPIRLRGPIQVDALKEALDCVLQRHEVLRTNFVEREGIPEAVVAEFSPRDLPVYDLRELTKNKQQEELDRLIKEKSLQPFDLASDPKIHNSLFRLDEEEHVLLCVTHHIASDGWSRGVLVRELAGHYKAFVSGEPSPFEALPIQYSDYTRWQNKLIESKAFQAQLDFWHSQLENLPAPLELPTDRPRPTEPLSRGAAYVRYIPADKTQALLALATREQVTPFMLLLTAFNALLYRCTGQEDVVIGSPVAGRKIAATETMIGFFVNMLVMRNGLSGNLSFRDLLKKVRQHALGSYANADVPFEQLVEQLKVERDWRRNPLFQIGFDVYRPKSQNTQAADVSFELMEIQRETTVFDQMWNIAILDEGLRIRVEYSTDLYDASTIERTVRHFDTLLDGVLSDPDMTVDNLPLLDPEEKDLIERVWSGSSNQAEIPELRVHDLFERQAQQRPDHPALLFEEQTYSYQQLDTLANGMAAQLRAYGVENNARVALWAERSPEFFAAVLAILKAGGCYLPLNPSNPQDRFKFMLENAEAALLLTPRQSLRLLPKNETKVLVIEDLIQAVDVSAEPAQDADSSSLAYAIYTSGSTGRPKGVAMPHAAMVNLMDWQSRHSQADASWRTLQSSSLGFDVSFQELFATWSTGGTLVSATEEERSDPQLLWEKIGKENIQRLFVPTVLLQQLAETFSHVQVDPWPSQLREIITAGEQLVITADIRNLFKKLPQCRLINQYGPTETHVVSSYPLPEDPDQWPTLPAIGRPISNAEVHILDKHLRPVPTGITGEIYVGGVCLAKGYLGDPKLAEEVFITDSRSEKRLYRTGDLARWQADGTIEFLGRADTQIKIRGYRIEPGEVEAFLLGHPRIAQAAVVAREVQKGDSEKVLPVEKQLVAYIVPEEPNTPVAIDQLRAFLKHALPEPMLPSDYVTLDALPYSPNGKVDRKALPAPDIKRDLQPEKQVPPRTDLEEKIAEAWCKVFGLESVSVEANFFDLGGHSLLANRLCYEIKRRTGIRVVISILLREPTIAALAAHIESENQNTKFRSLVVLQETGDKPPLFCIHGWGGEVYGFLDIARHLAPDRPVYGLQAIGLDGSTPRHTRVEDMAELYASEILTQRSEGPYHLIGHSAGGWIAYAVAQTLLQAGHKVNLCILDSRMSCRVPVWLFLPVRCIELSTRLSHHYRNLKMLPAGKRRQYMTEKLTFAKIKLFKPRESQAILEQRSQGKLGSSEIEYYVSVIQEYAPDAYQGDLTMFAVEKFRWYHRIFWKYYVKGRINVHYVEGKHTDIIMPNYVGNLSSQLIQTLDMLDES